MNDIVVVLVDGSEATNDIYASCALIHASVISKGFLPKLGNKFLATLYSSFAKSEYSFLIVAKYEGEIVGFIAISLHTENFYKWFIKNNIFRVSFQILPKIVKFSFLIKIFESLMYPFKKTPTSPYISTSEIFNFCVNDTCQGKGVGKLLFQRAIKELKYHGISTLKIVTGSEQKSAQKFYNTCGAKMIYQTEIHKNTTSLIYQYNISNDSKNDTGLY